MKEKNNSGEILKAQQGVFKDRIRMLFVKMLSLKFLSYLVYLIVGIIWFAQMLKNKIWDVGLWGLWVGFLTAGLAIYTTGNVKTKQISAVAPNSIVVESVQQ